MVALKVQFPAVGPTICAVALVILTFANGSMAYAANADDNSAIPRMRINSSATVVMTDDRQKTTGMARVPMAIRVVAPIDEQDAPRCGEKVQPFCRDLAASEFQMTSLRFMLPEVRGLSPKSLNIRRNSVSATYTFR